MNNMLRGLVLGGLLMAFAGDAQAGGPGRGDHDTPATERRSQGLQPRTSVRTCRNDDGWVVCRDAAGRWRRDRYDPWYGCDDDDWRCGAGGILPRHVVIDWLHDWDFDDLRDMRLRDDVYTLKAVDPHGRPVRLTIDAHSGRILRRDLR